VSGGSGFPYSNGSFTDINYPGTTGDAATGINDRGDSVQSSTSILSKAFSITMVNTL